jgi:urea carboxylase
VFDAVLVANRGEIARRIIRTVQGLGARAVAVYSDADATSLHVTEADRAIRIGPSAPSASYLDIDAVVGAALASGAQAVHPGYGFLSESAPFAEAVEAAGLVFIGPTPDQLASFGLKHTSRRLAEAAGVPLLPGSPLLRDVESAVAFAASVAYPVVLKAAAGGGGIGMEVCANEAHLRASYATVRRQAGAAFGDDQVYLERYLDRARHIEVQLFGDGAGRVVVVGDRDCSVQRRNQKVVEEAPASGLDPELRDRLHAAARSLGASVAYRSAGTVEMLLEEATGTLAFLEVNARLQVEHPVTEAVTGIDLVGWMVRLAAGDTSFLSGVGDVVEPSGCSVEARIYAEDPDAGYRPSAGTITHVSFPDGVRVDGWVESGTEVTTSYDPLLSKVVAVAPTRHAAVAALGDALAATRIDGIATNLDQLRSVVADPAFRAGAVSTRWLGTLDASGRSVEVLEAGASTTVQELPGRLGYWAVGVPPSGPMDDASFRLGNRAVGNPEEAAALEAAAAGPTLRFRAPALVCLAGAPVAADLDGQPVPMWEPVKVETGSVLRMGAIGPPGLRTSIHVRGGIDVSPILGSRATFSLGGLGGYGGRALQPGDVLRLGDPVGPEGDAGAIPEAARTPLTDSWRIEVTEGPHSAPEFLTASGVDDFLGATWEVHHNSSRTGVRLIGPPPPWARHDGGEAGLHPSNIHDTPYAVGAVDLAGDMPIILGPDGPSLGGFVCPVTVVASERWKLGQLRPGDRVTLARVTVDEVAGRHAVVGHRSGFARPPTGGVLDRWEEAPGRPSVCWRLAGDENLLVEYGPMALDLALRFRVHALEEALTASRTPGLVETTPGIRSLQVHVDPRRLSLADALDLLRRAELGLPSTEDVEVDSRIVHLPLSWDDPATRLAIERYMSTVRDDAPWCPWNIEFIRRINGLDDVADVHRIVYDASYLVLGLGDVYLGAPVATPLDPRHRLVTTKYNPARTWTPENAVGIGGAYLCVYGIEGPGGYQFVGRTVPVWNRFRRTPSYQQPWLLRFFDQIRFFEVSSGELDRWRRDLPLGRIDLDITPTRLRLRDQVEFLARNAGSIEAFQDRQRRAFRQERHRWEASGEFERAAAEPEVAEEHTFAPGSTVVRAPMHASVWQVPAEPGARLAAGDALVVLEAMKMEMSVRAPAAGTVATVLVAPGQEVRPGQPLVAFHPPEGP